MGAILHALAQSSTSEIEIAGMWWRCRKVRSADLAEVGVAALQMAQPGTTDDKKKGEEVEAALKRMTPDQAKQIAGYQEAVVCAGLLAVGDGDSWEEVSLVATAGKANPDKGKLYVGDLPPTVTEGVFAEVMRLSTDAGEASERLESFRSGPRVVVGD